MPEPAGEVLMIIDPVKKEAYREEMPPGTSGPLFFTSRAKLDAYARKRGIRDYEVSAVPEGVLARMKGKPHWVDGTPRG